MELDIQKMVDNVAKLLIIEFPDKAKNDPMWIGETARKSVLETLTWMTEK